MKQVTIIIFALGILLSNAFGQNDPGFFTAPLPDALKVFGKVTTIDKEGKVVPLKGVYVTYYKLGSDPDGNVPQDKIYDGMWIQGQGPMDDKKYWYILDVNSKYIVTFRKRGYATVKFEFDTKVPDTDVGHVVFPMEFDFQMPHALYNYDYKNFKKPLAKFQYQYNAELFGQDKGCFECLNLQKEVIKVNNKMLEGYKRITKEDFDPVAPPNETVQYCEECPGPRPPRPVAAAVPKPKPPKVVVAPEKLSDNINKNRSDQMHHVDADGNIYISRTLYRGNVGGQYSGQDIWMAEPDGNGGFKEAKNDAALRNINNESNNTVVGFSKDGKRMYVTNAYQSEKDLARGIAVSTKQGDTWSTPTPIQIPEIKMRGDFIGYAISPDEKAIIISVDRPGTVGEDDLFVSTKNADGTWSEPQHMGEKINSTGFETSPWIAPDGKTIYFGSNRNGGYGNTDIWMARRGDSWTDWSEPVNLGPEINSPRDEAYFFKGKDGSMYFSSSKDGSSYDIYVASSKPRGPSPAEIKYNELIASAEKEREDAQDFKNELGSIEDPHVQKMTAVKAKEHFVKAKNFYSQALEQKPGDQFATEMLSMMQFSETEMTEEIAAIQYRIDHPDVVPPAIKSLTVNPKAPGPGDEITVSANITHDEGIKKVSFFWGTSLDDLGAEIVMQASGDNYSTSIPALGEAGSVYYRIVAVSNDDVEKKVSNQILIETEDVEPDVEPTSDVDEAKLAAEALIEAQEQQREALVKELEAKEAAEQLEAEIELTDINIKAGTRKQIFLEEVAIAKREQKKRAAGL